jgi:hypothetical protein
VLAGDSTMVDQVDCGGMELLKASCGSSERTAFGGAFTMLQGGR